MTFFTCKFFCKRHVTKYICNKVYYYKSFYHVPVYMVYGTNGKQRLPLVCCKWKRQTSVCFLQTEVKTEVRFPWSGNTKR
jgi:hypothetical protein